MDPNGIYPVEAIIDLSKNPEEIHVKPIFHDPWEDLNLWLEVTGMMLSFAMQYREITEEEILEYATDYFKKCFRDYKIKNGIGYKKK